MKTNTIELLINAYFDGTLGRRRKLGYYRVTEDRKLEYHGYNRGREIGIDVLAMQLPNELKVGNASRLDYCGSYSRGQTAPAQQIMIQKGVPMIPFNVFEEANIDLATLNVIQQGKEEELLLPKQEWSRHLGQMKDVDIYDNQNTTKEPFTDSKKIILKKKQITNDRLMKDKKGQPKRDKKGNRRYRKVKVWSSDFIDMTQLEKRHYIGAMLLEAGGKRFLFDVDRNELKHYHFNAFLVELKGKPNTIKAAYDSLMPKEVKAALKKGLKVKRQGEWFFIPTPPDSIKIPKLPASLQKKLDARQEPEPQAYGVDSFAEYHDENKYLYTIKQLKTSCDYTCLLPKYRKPLIERLVAFNKVCKAYNKEIKAVNKQVEKFDKAHKYYEYGGELDTGVTRPNRVGKLLVKNGINYVKGEVTHTGREHHPITLADWHTAVPNTGVKSFTITGDID